MGLDAVELVMEVEETFDFTIPDAEAEKILTIGDLYRYVLARLDGPIEGPPRCLSASTFYRLRRKLIGDFRIERRRIRPATALDELISAANRRAEWQRLGEGLGWKLPDLVRPGWVGFAFLGLLLTWTATVILAWGWLAGFAQDAAFPSFLAILVGAIPLAIAVYQATRPLAIGFRSPDIRGLIPSLLAANSAEIRGSNPRGWNPQEVWEMLIAIIVAQTGVAPDQLTESTSFVNDLY